MKWRKVDDYHSISDSGYKVAKNFNREECRYSAYSPRPFPDWELIGFYTTPQAAAKACVAHSERGA